MCTGILAPTGGAISTNHAPIPSTQHAEQPTAGTLPGGYCSVNAPPGHASAQQCAGTLARSQ
eukprot:12887603-Prorocentrum_lima.AAC.1